MLGAVYSGPSHEATRHNYFVIFFEKLLILDFKLIKQGAHLLRPALIAIGPTYSPLKEKSGD